MISELALLVFQQSSSGAGMTPLLMMVAVFAVFYFLLIMPQQKQRKKWQKMISDLKSGDRVTTSGGIVGVIISIRQGEGNDPGCIVLRVAPDNVKIEVSRTAIQSISVDEGQKNS